MLEKLFDLLFPSLKPFIEKLLLEWHLQKFLPYMQILYWLILIILFFIGRKIWNKITSLIRKKKVNKNTDELLDYYTPYEIYNARKNYIPTYGQKVDPSSFLEPGESTSNKIKKRNLIKYFFKEFNYKRDDKKFFLVLGDSGMGKTTFLLNLYIKYRLRISYRKKKKIYLVPLSNSKYKSKIRKIEKESRNAILLLDAFDEDVTSWSNPERSLQELLHLVSGFSKIIITSRGQFFSSSIDNLIHLNIFKTTLDKQQYDLNKIYLSPLDNKHISFYLLKKYGVSIIKLLKARRIVVSCPNLMVRPMLLNNIDYLLTEKSDYTFTAEIYAMLILSWLRREKKFVDENSILSFSRELAVNIYIERNKRKGLYISESDLDGLLKGSLITKNSVLFKTRSLLNRTGDKYKFSHKSIFEYFLAESKFPHVDLNILHAYDFDNPFYLEGLSDAHRFFKELFILKVTIPYINDYSNLSVSPKSIKSTKFIDLSGSKIKSLLFLKELTWLERLDLSKTIVRNLIPLYSLSNLKTLKLSGTFYDPSFASGSDAISELEALKANLPELIIKF